MKRFLLLFCLFVAAPSWLFSVENKDSIYMVVYRTPAHVRSSKPEVFHGFAQDLAAYLREKKVNILVDPERGTIESESPMTVPAMTNVARQVGATSLLFVTIDRPVTKWIKVVVQAYDLEGKLLWAEEASDMGGMTGKSGYQRTLKRMKEDLDKRLNGPGLPVQKEQASVEAAPAAEEKKQ